MHRQTAQHGKSGLILLITAAIVTAVLLIPNIAHGLGSVTITTQKSGSPPSFNVGEKVVFDSTIDIGTDTVGTSTALVISGSGGSPGPESVNVSIPIKDGAQDLTSQLPVDGVTSESGSLTVTSTLTELGAAPGGYANGYTGSDSTAKIVMVITWTPLIEADSGGSTTAGDYDATIAANGTPSSAASFEVIEVSAVTVTVSSPADGSGTSAAAVDISGTVNGPTVSSVSVGVSLPDSVLFGNDAKTAANSLETGADQALFTFSSSPNLWHVMDDTAGDFDSCSVKPPTGDAALGYTQDSTCNYNTGFGPGGINSGNADSSSFVVGTSTVISFDTWFDTEPGTLFDRKLIQLVESGVATTIAQITSDPPIVGGFPDFSATPGTVYMDTFVEPHPLIFIPLFFTGPFGGGSPSATWTSVSLDLATIEGMLSLAPGFFEGKTVELRFRFDTVDDAVNDFQGWFVDDIKVVGSGSITPVVLSVTNLAFASTGTPFTLNPGANKFTVTATNGYPTPVIGSATFTVIRDANAPVVSLNTLVAVTNTSTLTISGSYVEATPKLLQVALYLDDDGVLESTDKILLSDKTFDPSDLTFSVVANLSEGANRILVKLTDKVSLAGTDEDTVLLDTTAPSLNLRDPVYPIGEVSARGGDPIVFQVFATDTASGIAKVEFFPPGESTAELLLPTTSVPGAVLDQWQLATDTNFVLPVVVPSGVPAGTFSLNVTVTDKAGNTATGTVTGTITAALQAYNIYLMPGSNLISTPLIPDNASLATLLTQKVLNINAAYKSTLEATDTDSDASNDLDANGNATLANVITKIDYYTGGPQAGSGATAGDPGTFIEYTPWPAADDLTTLQVGRGYWIFAVDSAFKLSDPLAPGLPSTPAPIKVTISGTFLTPGSVPPIFPVLAEWNLVGLHSENAKNVGNLLDSLVFSSSGTKAWSSLLEYLNVVSFNFAPEEGSEDERVTITLGAFNSLDTTDSGQLGRGFWLFALAAGSITP